MFDEVVLSMSLMNKILSLDTVSGQLIMQDIYRIAGLLCVD